MKKNSKFLAVAAVAMMAGLSLAACGGNSTKTYSDVNTKITVWATAKEEAVIKSVVDTYNAKQTSDTAKFNYSFVAVSEADAGTTVAKDPLVDNAPALFLCADDHIFNLASKDIVLELKGTYKTSIQENNSAVSVLGATYNDKLYGYPVTSDNGYFLWYNKSALTDANVASLEDLLATAKKQGKKVLMDVANGWYANSFVMSPSACGTTSLSWAADSTGKVAYTCNWDNDAGVAASKYINSLLQPYYADGTLIIGSNDAIVAGFQDGSLIGAVSGTWMESDVTKYLGTNVAATKLPEYHIDGKAYQMASFTGSKIYSVNKTRPVAEQKAAVALADLLTNKESQLVRFKERQAIPCNKEALASSDYTSNVTIGAKALGMQNAFAAVQSQSAQDRYWDIGKAIGQAYLDGNLGTYTDWATFLKGEIDTLRKAQ